MHRNASKVKAHFDPTTRAHLVRGALYLFLLIAVCAIPFALAERNTTKPGKPSLRPVIVGISAAADSIQKYNLSMPAGTPTPTPTCGGPAAWQPGPDQPPARYAFQAALGTDNLLYVAGGQTADMVPTLYDQVSRYNYTTNTWSNVAPLPVPLGQATIGSWNGKIYVAGGFIGGSSVTNALRIYDIASNTWTSGANMPTSPGVEAAAGAVVDGKFYVMGGDDFNNGLNTNFIYDIATNTWTTGATLPDSRTNTCGTANIGVIYVYGGVMLPAFTTTDTLLRYDPVANSWTNLGSAGTAGLGNYGGISPFVRPFNAGQLLITDGADSMGVSTNSTHIFTISSGTFSAGPPMIGNRAGHAQGTLFD
jgi:N-acetylneuraminic acid mutarotase